MTNTLQRLACNEVCDAAVSVMRPYLLQLTAQKNFDLRITSAGTGRSTWGFHVLNSKQPNPAGQSKVSRYEFQHGIGHFAQSQQTVELTRRGDFIQAAPDQLRC